MLMASFENKQFFFPGEWFWRKTGSIPIGSSPAILPVF